MNLEFNEKIQIIQEKVNIVEVVGKYLKLTRKGNNFWAVCPFHEDSNPSLSVSQDKQIFKCFACGEHGNVFKFLQKYKGVDFFTALKEAAATAKIDLAKFDLQINDFKSEPLHPFKALNNLALSFYQYQLTTSEGKKALNYLQERHISKKNIEEFKIGYAPGNNQLVEYLKLQGYSLMDIIESGLAKINDQDRVKDMFFNRIIFPILDLEGNCLGFSARKYLESGEDNFKYINTPETKIFKKGQVLYNLYQAKKTAAQNVLYIVEGYMDVISLSNQNIKNCVALMGTNLTKDHIYLLNKITKNIIIFLDGDQAGKNAAVKMAVTLIEHNFNVKVIDNPTTLDPDDLINKELSTFKTVVSKTLHPLDFAIKFFLKKFDIYKDSEQLKLFLVSLQPLWNIIKDEITLNFYLSELQKITTLSSSQLLTVLQASQYLAPATKRIIKSTSQKRLQPITLYQKLLEVQKQLFYLLFLDRKVYLFLEEQKFIFYNKNLMNLYYLVVQYYQENEQLTAINAQELLASLKDNEIYDFFKGLLQQFHGKKFEVNQEILKDYLKIIKKYFIEIEIEKLNQQIVQTPNLDTKIELLKKMSNLKNQLNK